MGSVPDPTNIFHNYYQQFTGRVEQKAGS